ncbi:XTP/dITP diphosphatase [Clostridium akagii]|uniref:XTP/dITP diphosphatase n=1 Tax=Clostridium akagii TaxID=91623 RepID=UPI00047E5259|nr:XTP/dITP diphosphatase [Clostridium akagii]
MKKLIVASNNQGKIKEIKEILKSFDLEILSLKEAEIKVDIVEDGETFMDNAYKKAYEIYKLTGEMVLSDDSGLMVDALNGAPGVFSARFAGEHGNDKKNNKKLLKLLKGKKNEDRKAKFVAAMVLIVNGNNTIKVQGEAKGYIIEDERGNNGFGYDPLFFIPELNKTFAELDGREKNSISHRGKALELLKDKLKKL